FKKTLLKGETPMLIMELPPYKRPLLRVVSRHMWDRSRVFLRRAGTVILGINIILWFLATYPRNQEISRQKDAQRIELAGEILPQVKDPGELAKRAEELKHYQLVDPRRVNDVPKNYRAIDPPIQNHGAHPSVLTVLNPKQFAAFEKLQQLDQQEVGEKLRGSFAGKMGRLIEPIIAPLGFDWKMGIGIVASFAAREVFVSTMSTVYNVGDYDSSESSMKSLAKTLQLQKRSDGTPVYTALTGVTLMVFYVFALQCAST